MPSSVEGDKKLNKKKLQEALKKFKKEHPEWGEGELRDIDEDLRQRHTYRDANGKMKHVTVVNFSDLPPITDEDGNEVPFEDTLTEEDRAF